MEVANDIPMSFRAAARGVEVFVGYRGVPVVNFTSGQDGVGRKSALDPVEAAPAATADAAATKPSTAISDESAAISVTKPRDLAAARTWEWDRLWRRIAGGWSRYIEGVISTTVAAGTVLLYQRTLSEGDDRERDQLRRSYTAAFIERKSTRPAPKTSET